MGHLITRGQHTLVDVLYLWECAVPAMLRLSPSPLSSVSPPAGEVKSVVWAGQHPQGSGGEDQLPEGGQGTRSASHVGPQSMKPAHSTSRPHSVWWVNRRQCWQIRRNITWWCHIQGQSSLCRRPIELQWSLMITDGDSAIKKEIAVRVRFHCLSESKWISFQI